MQRTEESWDPHSSTPYAISFAEYKHWRPLLALNTHPQAYNGDIPVQYRKLNEDLGPPVALNIRQGYKSFGSSTPLHEGTS